MPKLGIEYNDCVSRLILLACPALALFALALPSAAAVERLSHGRFADVAVYRPAGRVRQFVLLLSGTEGGAGALNEVARVLAYEGGMVAAIDSGRLIDAFVRNHESCFFPDGDLENLSHYIQAYYKLPAYLTPVLVGYAEGGGIAQALMSRAAPDIFTGAVLIAERRDMQLALPLCEPGAKDVVPPAPAVLAAQHPDRLQRVPALELGPAMPQLEAAYTRVAALRPPPVPPPASLADLPIVEVPASGTSDLFAVFLSGDGGWAGIDKNVAAALAARGIPVAGVDSLRYFWSQRTPEGLASDIDRVMRYYAARWNKQRVLLIGYSQGADVLPFALNRLPAAAKRMTALAVLMGLSDSADFEFHLTNWISSGKGGQPVLPEIGRLHDLTALCLYGSDDEDTVCPRLHGEAVRSLELEGGHHFDGEYDRVAQTILGALPD